MCREVCSYKTVQIVITTNFTGTLKRGAIIIADTAIARVRLLRNDKGEIQNEVSPGYPTEIEGWKDLPPAGELVLEVESEKRAKEAIRFRNRKKQLEQQEEDAKVYFLLFTLTLVTKSNELQNE